MRGEPEELPICAGAVTGTGQRRFTEQRLQQLLKRPNWALETWGVAQEKYLSALEDHHKEKYLREEAELLGRYPPVDYVTKVANADPDLALTLLHDQNPELDIEHIQDVEDLEVALAVLNIV